MVSIYLIYVLNIGLNLIQTKYDKNWNFSDFLFPEMLLLFYEMHPRSSVFNFIYLFIISCSRLYSFF